MGRVEGAIVLLSFPRQSNEKWLEASDIATPAKTQTSQPLVTLSLQVGVRLQYISYFTLHALSHVVDSESTQSVPMISAMARTDCVSMSGANSRKSNDPDSQI